MRSPSSFDINAKNVENQVKTTMKYSHTSFSPHYFSLKNIMKLGESVFYGSDTWFTETIHMTRYYQKKNPITNCG